MNIEKFKVCIPYCLVLFGIVWYCLILLSEICAKNFNHLKVLKYVLPPVVLPMGGVGYKLFTCPPLRDSINGGMAEKVRFQLAMFIATLTLYEFL